MGVTKRSWEAFRRGPSEKTFAAFYSETSRLVYSRCARLLRDPTDVQDAFQSTYCRLLLVARKGGEGEPIKDVQAFVSRVAIRVADLARYGSPGQFCR
jgi:DNA-directed RNA polymerase specialized sigma24 family protein